MRAHPTCDRGDERRNAGTAFVHEARIHGRPQARNEVLRERRNSVLVLKGPSLYGRLHCGFAARVRGVRIKRGRRDRIGHVARLSWPETRRYDNGRHTRGVHRIHIRASLGDDEASNGDPALPYGEVQRRLLRHATQLGE